MENTKEPENGQPGEVLTRQQKRAIDRAIKVSEKPLPLQPMTWRMANAERRIAHLERLLVNMANLLVVGKVLEAHVVDNQTVLRIPAPRRPWWQVWKR